MITLILSHGGPSRPLHFDRKLITIGRTKDSIIALNDKKVSRAHAKIELAGAVWKIEDLNSGNGTKVNGLRIDVHELALEDVIKIGDAELVVKAIEVDADEGGGGASDRTTDLNIEAID